MKIHLVVNISRVYMYKDQVEGQRKKQPLSVVIKGEEEYKVEKILNKRKFRGKDRYLVQWKGYIAEEDTWKPRENLENARDLVEKFEEEYREESRCCCLVMKAYGPLEVSVQEELNRVLYWILLATYTNV